MRTFYIEQVLMLLDNALNAFPFCIGGGGFRVRGVNSCFVVEVGWVEGPVIMHILSQ